nr:hypothetical protein Iba_chr14dCG3890 [Ipomoea batatas]
MKIGSSRSAKTYGQAAVFSTKAHVGRGSSRPRIRIFSICEGPLLGDGLLDRALGSILSAQAHGRAMVFSTTQMGSSRSVKSI